MVLVVFGLGARPYPPARPVSSRVAFLSLICVTLIGYSVDITRPYDNMSVRKRRNTGIFKTNVAVIKRLRRAIHSNDHFPLNFVVGKVCALVFYIVDNHTPRVGSIYLK